MAKIHLDIRHGISPTIALECVKQVIVRGKVSANVNKVEPKFKVGDWVIYQDEGCTEIFKISGITETHYICIDISDDYCRNLNINFIDNHNYRLWTIKDTKPGDVLVDEDNNIGIYKEIKDNWWNSYIYLGCNNCLYGPGIGGMHGQNSTKPATKEQRDLLFSKMKEAEYEWDADKKELRKIEQKHTNESNFKAGDLIVDNCGYVWKIEGILNQFYILEGIEGGESRPTIEWVNKTFHLWTIADAKDGDILKEDSCIFIIKRMKPNGTAIVHCCLFDDGDFNLGSTLSFDVDSTYPATKEQCKLLFSKMKEAGYEWSEEFKEIRKTPTPADVGFAKLGEIWKKEADAIAERQNLAWSEEDERIYQSIMDDTVQENQLDGKQIDWLKDIKYRYFPQSKQEWGEEDEEIFKEIVGDIEVLELKTTSEKYSAMYKKELSWLESLKDRMQPKNNWKPNDEQIGVIEALIENRSFQRRHLVSLYEQLKKLKEK